MDGKLNGFFGPLVILLEWDSNLSRDLTFNVDLFEVSVTLVSTSFY